MSRDSKSKRDTKNSILVSISGNTAEKREILPNSRENNSASNKGRFESVFREKCNNI